MPTLAEQFLRFLAAPREFQQSYVPFDGVKEVACELRMGCYKGFVGLELLFCIGADSLYWPDFRQIEKPEAREDILYVFALCNLITEHNEVQSMTSEDDVAMTPHASLWRLFRKLSVSILKQLNLPCDPPSKSFDEVYLPYCTVLTGG